MRVGENNKKIWSKGGTTIFSMTERKTSIQEHFSMSDEEPWRAQANVKNYFRCSYCILHKKSAKKAI